MHWRSTARHDELMVRLEERPWRGGVTVLLDRRAGAHRGHGPTASLEWAVSFAASACVHLIDRGEPVELVTEDGGCPVPPGASGGADGVLDALATLPTRQREVLVLRYYLDYSERDIAHALGISQGAVKAHASRGAAALRTSLEKP